MTGKQIIVIGGGPGGAATAIGLARIGYTVTIIRSPRTFSACEGISRRTLTGLHSAGCHRAAASASPPSLKNACWNGQSNQSNSEHLLYRPLFDNGLVEDMAAWPITQRVGLVLRIEDDNEQWRVIYQDAQKGEQTVTGDFLVEARGRSGTLKNAGRWRGPETVSLLQRWQTDTARDNASMAASYRHGWAWLAQMGSNLYTQITLSAQDPRIPKKGALRPFIVDELIKIPESSQWLDAASPVATPIARASTCILANEPAGKRWLLVGDAALATDPLSGNGIFTALSLALAAPAVINTLLSYPQRATLALRFYRDKCRETFLRFCRTGRDFYQLEQRWAEHPFWQERSRWPDTKPLHGKPDLQRASIEARPVLMHDQIISKEVLVTPEYPMGIWRVAGIELAPVIKALRGNPRPSESWLKNWLHRFNYEPHQKASLLGWLAEYHFV